MPSVPRHLRNISIHWFSALVLYSLLWASGFVAAKYGLPYAEPFTLMAARFIVAAVFSAGLLLLKASWPKTPKVHTS